jgi:hypothetical protein
VWGVTWTLGSEAARGHRLSRLFAVEQIGAAFGAHRSARRLGYVGRLRSAGVGWMLIMSVVVDPDHPLVSVSL